MRPTIDFSGHQKSMPVHGRVNVERILDRHLHLVAAAQPDGWSKDRSRVAIGQRRLALDECVPSGGDLQSYRAPLFSRVDQRRDGQAPGEVHRLALREANAGNAANETARNDCGGPDCELASAQHRMQNSPSFKYNESESSHDVPGNTGPRQKQT
jgi:hypothetical protein